MEPTPELLALADVLAADLQLGCGTTKEEVAGALMARAAELRAALEPFERAANFPPSVKLAVLHGAATVEQMRAVAQRAFEAAVAMRPAPAVVPKRSFWARLTAWVRK